ncbi:hypothetical protein [Vibrio mediterranei]|uniref:hypothetical protein n=1 Tax=Vibrio mediterranei TaxID=689 RepID=UPI001EFC7E5E|nr:hypothetical protein [Vibrio mediterranei]MCG9659726.1 hypothetical protein [Vibrio mediterranei]
MRDATVNLITSDNVVKPKPTVKPEYYTAGFPDNIKPDGYEHSITPRHVVIDFTFTTSRYWDDKDSILDFSRMPGFAGYIDCNGRNVSDLSATPKKFINMGEVAFSVIFKANSWILSNVRTTYTPLWKKVISSTASAHNAPTLVATTHTGVSNSTAYNLAKTTGTSLSLGGGIDLSAKASSGSGSGASISGSVAYTMTNTLTQEWGRSMSVEQWDELQVRQQFEITDYSRRVAIYQFYEVFTSSQSVNWNGYIGDALKVMIDYYRIRPLTKQKYIEVPTSTFVALEVGEPTPMTDLTPSTQVEPEFKSIVHTNRLWRDHSFPHVAIEVLDLRQTSGLPVYYDFNRGTFVVRDKIEFELVVNIQTPGSYYFDVHTIEGGGGGGLRTLNKGVNVIRASFGGKGPGQFDNVGQIYIALNSPST